LGVKWESVFVLFLVASRNLSLSFFVAALTILTFLSLPITVVPLLTVPLGTIGGNGSPSSCDVSDSEWKDDSAGEGGR
jgi:hypothetical protein